MDDFVFHKNPNANPEDDVPSFVISIDGELVNDDQADKVLIFLNHPEMQRMLRNLYTLHTEN
jgi:hypothetical protein